MVTVHHQGGTGYAATSDLSDAGVRAAAEQACSWAKATAGKGVFDFSKIKMSSQVGSYRAVVEKPWDSVPLQDKIDRLMGVSQSLKVAPAIVDWVAYMWNVKDYRLYLTNQGGRIEQEFEYLIPDISVTANEGTESVNRSTGGRGSTWQGGMEILERAKFDSRGVEIAQEALELLAAPVCPSGTMDLLLAPDQMMLQIHESIGHPLELDRILGDERNFAGTSFVTLDMFGTYRYGSDLLNISYDPNVRGELASFAYDDDGAKGEKVLLIENGILQRPLGGDISQIRAGGIAGVANSRSVSWKRPAIDRMANLNLEAGRSSLTDMIASIDQGVYMKANNSWSIDDSRNKFQFGCEWGRVIKGGKLGHLVKKPSYRGISASFWRNLRMTGSTDTLEVMGTPYCGKGEPGQVIRVGHASPACLFGQVEVFGGEK
jgi:predicted Zn-dependent protease